jgi:hypothetical protein
VEKVKVTEYSVYWEYQDQVDVQEYEVIEVAMYR